MRPSSIGPTVDRLSNVLKLSPRLAFLFYLLLQVIRWTCRWIGDGNDSNSWSNSVSRYQISTCSEDSKRVVCTSTHSKLTHIGSFTYAFICVLDRMIYLTIRNLNWEALYILFSSLSSISCVRFTIEIGWKIDEKCVSILSLYCYSISGIMGPFKNVKQIIN